jgi:hypothetical protein
VDLDRSADLARMLLRQGLVAEALDTLDDLADEGAVPGVALDLDDEGRVVVDAPFDPLLADALHRLPGASRDRAAGVWRVGRAGLDALVDLLVRLATTPCAPEVGCTLGDEPAVSSVHRDAHERACR